METNATAIEVSGISKSFNHKAALSDISFRLNKGEIVGIIGPNGSGKTTLLNILTGMISQSKGSFSIGTHSTIGMAVSRKGFFDDMSVRENVLLFARLLNVDDKNTDEVMDTFSIDFKEKQFGSLSAGMKQRVSLTIPFLKELDIVLLDEPTNHLDIDSIIFLRELILKKRAEGNTFLITSHILSDLEKICDKIVFMKDGRIIKISDKDELIATFGNLETAYLEIVQAINHNTP